MKRILLLATVAALMATMLVATASAALALPPAGRPAGGTQGTPAGGSLGCEGGTNNANHAVNGSNPSSDATGSNPSVVDRPSDNGLGGAPGYNGGDNVGLDNASDTVPIYFGDNCQNAPPQHPLG
jgi:hypothetical protein